MARAIDPELLAFEEELSKLDSRLFAEAELDGGAELELLLEQIDKVLHEFPKGQIDCSAISSGALDCDMTPAELNKIKESQNREGAFLDRTSELSKEGNRSDILALQLTDYDVNDWFVRKPKHQEALGLIRDFIVERGRQSGKGIEVTITGSASRTGSKEYNDTLSCKRANCAALRVRDDVLTIAPALTPRLRINPSGDGFSTAVCRGTECELPEFRSVLIAVHAPGQPPPPIEIRPTGWDKYKIRCCSFKTENLLVGTIGDVLDKGFGALPPQIRDRLKGLLGQLIKKGLESIPRFGKALSAALRLFPAEIIRDRAVFEIVEREKTSPRSIVLCYESIVGIRIPIPTDAVVDEIVKRVPEEVREVIKQVLKRLLGITAKEILPPLASSSPGPFKSFDVDHKIFLSNFSGEAVIGRDTLMRGKVNLVFNSKAFSRLDDKRARIKKESCSDCTASGVPMQVGAGDGFELFGISQGMLKPGDCKCIEAPQRVLPVARRTIRFR